jgi:hypothetical protein
VGYVTRMKADIRKGSGHGNRFGNAEPGCWHVGIGMGSGVDGIGGGNILGSGCGNFLAANDKGSGNGYGEYAHQCTYGFGSGTAVDLLGLFSELSK